MALGGRASLERSEVAAATGARILLPRVQPVFSRRQMTNHAAKTSKLGARGNGLICVTRYPTLRLQQGILYRAGTPHVRSTGPASSRYSLHAARIALASPMLLAGQEDVMRPFGYVLLIATVALAGCAGQGARVPAAGLVASATPTGSDLTGTWVGSFGWPGGSYLLDEGACTLRIDADGTFRAVVTPAPGANNLAKASTWSGTAADVGQSRRLAQHHGSIGDPHSGRGPALRDGPGSHRGSTDRDLLRARSHGRPGRPRAGALAAAPAAHAPAPRRAPGSRGRVT